MATLSSGVLLKLIRDMKSSSSSDSDLLAADYLSDDIGDGSAILQVTGIVPAIADSDLFPDRGFYLQVSDSSHSTYVSLPPGNDDLILSDNLRLGQLILVGRLEASSPVPILHGLHLIPGRHPFPQHTAAIPAVSPATCSTNSPARPERKKRQQRPANTCMMDGRKIGVGMLHSNSCPGSPAQRKELGRASSILRQPMKIGVARNDEESDESDKSSVITCISNSSSHSFVSMIPRPKTVRKIWEPNERMKDKKRDDKPILKTPSSYGDFAHYSFSISKGESSEESWTSKRDGDVELTTLLNKRKSTPSKVSAKNPIAIIPLSTYDHDMKWPDNNVLWGSLTFNLVKYGKEVLRKRDNALYAALDALQEACALERLLRCLSTYSELQASKDGNPQKVVDKFLEFHFDLSREILATQPSARTNSSFSPPISTPTTSNAARDASERRKCAASWIKAALKSQLSRTPRIANAMPDSIESPSSDRKSQSSMSKQKKSAIDALSAAVSGPPTLNCNLMASDLAKALQTECNRWFLRYIEKFLDVIHSKRSCKANESQIASLLCQLKRVDDWLVTVSTKDKTWVSERSKESFLSEDDDAEACGRVRRKIYEILLRHVESAALALESMRTTDEDKVVAR